MTFKEFEKARVIWEDGKTVNEGIWRLLPPQISSDIISHPKAMETFYENIKHYCLEYGYEIEKWSLLELKNFRLQLVVKLKYNYVLESRPLF